jgi:hypothetical protein
LHGHKNIRLREGHDVGEEEGTMAIEAWLRLHHRSPRAVIRSSDQAEGCTGAASRFTDGQRGIFKARKIFHSSFISFCRQQTIDGLFDGINPSFSLLLLDVTSARMRTNGNHKSASSATSIPLSHPNGSPQANILPHTREAGDPYYIGDIYYRFDRRKDPNPYPIPPGPSSTEKVGQPPM